MKTESVLEWDKYWVGHEKTLFGEGSRIYRKYILSFYVKKILGLYFKQKGFFMDCGSGSSESSMRLIPFEKKYIAFDVSKYAVRKACNRFSNLKGVVGDIYKLPYKDESISGIYNLGVMEHFLQEDIVAILNEFYRVMIPGSCIVLFWPYRFSPFNMVMDSITFLMTRICRVKFWYTPDEFTRLTSKKHAKSIMDKTSFSIETIHFSIGDLFSHYVVVAKKAG
ncbi:MAG: class I SAM-dependent methyltransferase [Lentimicrobiaceae bacterium]|nr:class I SAM-dependent methyltransferase [Candidatus Scalindua sp.]MBT6671591.1 class I SAM-dependent methyltransferase [Lentimicrobiaceae bacterium]